jgi:citrate synthase
MTGLDQSRFVDRPDEEWLDSGAAVALLGVKAATLYTYVSRGLVRRVPAPGGRGSQYAREDLLRLRDRRDARSGHAAVASDALRWGQPVIDTEIGGIDSHGPIYRGRRALDLVASGTRFERVVDLLIDAEPASWDLFGGGALRERRGGSAVAVLDRMLAAVTAAGADDPHRHVPGREAPRVRSILRQLASCVPGLEAAPRPALDCALVLVADHELNASTLAARVTASTGADLYACVVAGLAALSGPSHGGAGARVEALLAECARVGPGDALRGRLSRGEGVPGFGHPLYPDGDPRCPPLLALAQQLAPRERPVLDAVGLVAAAGEARYEPPNLDLGLVAVAHALGLGDGGAIGLFAVGRAAGWMAHSMEQQAAGWMLRPRARYVGPTPAPPTE